VSRATLSRIIALGCAVAALGGGSFAGAALVSVDDIMLRANGGFQPQVLPRSTYAPIDFQGFFDISRRGGGQPEKLTEAVIDFDRDGRLSVGGLPSCAPSALAGLGVRQGRQTCPGAIVGTGRAEAFIDLSGGVGLQGSSALTIFNGPRQEGRPTVVLHARMTVPEVQTFAILVPIEKRRGGFRYRARLTIPEIAGGRGAITRVEVDVGRRFKSGGKQRSYVSARCSDGIIHTHGRFTFADGTIIDGSVEKGCTPR
jgi:hypothetical protein